MISLAQGLKLTKNKSKSELISEFQKLPDEKKLNRAIKIYFGKCWQGILYQGGKFNYNAYTYVKNAIFNNFTRQDLYLFYSFLLDLEERPLKIFDCLKAAKKFTEEEKSNYEKEQIKKLSVKKYDDFDLGDLLCQ